LVTRLNTPDFGRSRQHDQWVQSWQGISTFNTPSPNPLFPEDDILFNHISTIDFPDLNSAAVDFDMSFSTSLNDGIFSPHLAQEQLLNTFTAALGGHGPMLLPRQMRNHQNWLSRLPDMFGSKLLDTTVRAVALIHLGRTQHTEAFVQESRQFYGNALRLLNRSLSNDTDGMSSETLSATILLSFYEMFASDANSSWVRHSGGAGLLMRIRGPDRHLSGLDRDIYLAYRHTIVIDAFMRDEACFLAEPAWLDMAKKVHDDMKSSGFPEERLEIFDLAQEFYLEHVLIPATLRDARFMDDSKKKMTPEQFQSHRELVLARTQMHRAKLKSINLRLRTTLEAQGLQTATMDTGDPIFPKQYIFANVFIASTHTGHWTIMLMLNLILKEIEKDIAPEKNSLYVMENREMCREICRTTPFMLTSSFLGPFFVIFALRICLMVFEPGQERAWVIRKLQQISNTHMRMAADIPPIDPQQMFHDPPTQFPTNLRLKELV
jgi:hypothetical protein